MAGIAAKSYSDAIFEIAKEEHQLSTYNDQLIMVKNSVFQDTKFASVMQHPKIRKEEKKQLLETIYQSSVDALLLNFLKLLVDKNRFHLLNEITSEFIKSYHEEYHIQVVYLKSAAALQKTQKQELCETLEKKLHKKIELVCSIDERLIAGIRMRINDQIIDNSALSRLKRLKKQVVTSESMNK